MTRELTLSMPMHCDACENRLRTALQRAKGVIRADADHRRDEVRLRFDPGARQRSAHPRAHPQRRLRAGLDADDPIG